MPSVEDHGHCEICSRVVPIGERFCDRAECLEQHQRNLADKKKQVYLFVAMIAALVLLSVLLR